MDNLKELLQEAVDVIKQLPPEKRQEAVGVIKGMLLSENNQKTTA